MKKALLLSALIALVGLSAFAQIEPPSLTTGSFDFRYCKLAGCTMTGTLTQKLGTGTQTFVSAGLAFKGYTAATCGVSSLQTAADTNPTILCTYTLPANSLSADGQSLEVITWGTTAATANSKTIALAFGATSRNIVNGVSNGQTWIGSMWITRSGSSAQVGLFDNRSSTAFGTPAILAPAENTTGTIVIKVTGTNGTAAAGRHRSQRYVRQGLAVAGGRQ
jgi:hypothetical protein